MARPNALKWYDGPSEIDGSPIIGVVSGLIRPSSNRKTGDLFQTWILPRDVKPNDAVKTGEDRSVCGDCEMRPILHREKAVEDRPCYVKTFQGPRSVWEGVKGQPVATVDQLVNTPNRFTGLRFGAWGDPTAIPLHEWRVLLRIMCGSIDTRRSPGYTHQWRTCDRRWSQLLMASVHTEAERQEARALGYRTFRIVSGVAEVVRGEVVCPNVTHGVQCLKCALCNGSTGVDWDGRKDIAIAIHR